MVEGVQGIRWYEITVSGRTIGEEAAAAHERTGQEVVRPLTDPLKPEGGLTSDEVAAAYRQAIAHLAYVDMRMPPGWDGAPGSGRRAYRRSASITAAAVVSAESTSVTPSPVSFRKLRISRRCSVRP